MVPRPTPAEFMIASQVHALDRNLLLEQLWISVRLQHLAGASGSAEGFVHWSHEVERLLNDLEAYYLPARHEHLQSFHDLEKRQLELALAPYSVPQQAS